MTADGGSKITRDISASLNYSKALPSNSSSEQWFININASNNGNRDQNFENDVIQTTIHDIRGHEAET
ncbi:unnamed protein product, partial [Rotaria socialis]